MKHTLESLMTLARTDPGLLSIRGLVAISAGWQCVNFTRGQYSYRHWRMPGEALPDFNSDCFVSRPSLPAFTSELDAMSPIEVPLLRTDADTYIQHLKSLRGEHWGFASALERCFAYILTKQAPD